MSWKPIRAAKALYSLAALVRDPNRLGQVFEMADALSTPEVIDKMAAALARDPQGDRALDERPRIDVDLQELKRCPEGSLGRAFADTMIAQGLDPKDIPPLQSPDRATYVRAHLYETHDVWHTVTEFGTTWPEEIGLQAFYLAQIPGPLPAVLLAVGCLRVALFEMSARGAMMDAVARGWEMGKSARPLFGVRWNDLWNTPLDEVQAMLGVVPRAGGKSSAKKTTETPALTVS
ncbi:hypothetical protein AKJ09_01314 [Labilithrix luteola]|uniref:Ubiquinone biosynthesis protein COQ4 n=1 Tax=Labilithrix luteola TaxID=1391654 RepID=A0A0K1PM94_9BACT|nr:Coq4 family protein [Labilithrix luteola]AKU94650.1 hypothetical protein AKJ09_01314 [Labilithrix luteola]